jgi:predicted nuclease of restriction endonuclease-like (RecB) superfamily
VGKKLSLKVHESEWGVGTIAKLSSDIQSEYPEILGFSSSSLYRMKNFFEAYSGNIFTSDVPEMENIEKTPDDYSFFPTPLGEIGWSHNSLIVEMVKDTKERLFYVEMCKINQWSVATLKEKINQNEYENRQNFQNNFDSTITSSEKRDALTMQFKDDINLSFLGIREEILERELEDAIVKNIVRFLAELGQDILFAGRQYKIMIEGEEIRIDIMFYHRKLKCFIAVDLKVTDFKFQDAGQISGYLQAIDEQVKSVEESPSIGIIICRWKNQTKVEYALKASNKPIGVMTYSFKDLPREIAQYLPSDKVITESLRDIEDIEKEL